MALQHSRLSHDFQLLFGEIDLNLILSFLIVFLDDPLEDITGLAVFLLSHVRSPDVDRGVHRLVALRILLLDVEENRSGLRVLLGVEQLFALRVKVVGIDLGQVAEQHARLAPQPLVLLRGELFFREHFQELLVVGGCLIVLLKTVVVVAQRKLAARTVTTIVVLLDDLLEYRNRLIRAFQVNQTPGLIVERIVDELGPRIPSDHLVVKRHGIDVVPVLLAPVLPRMLKIASPAR